MLQITNGGSHLLGLSQLCFENLPIMLLSSAQKFSLLCSKLCSQNQDYAWDLIVLLEDSWLLY